MNRNHEIFLIWLIRESLRHYSLYMIMQLTSTVSDDFLFRFSLVLYYFKVNHWRLHLNHCSQIHSSIICVYYRFCLQNRFIYCIFYGRKALARSQRRFFRFIPIPRDFPNNMLLQLFFRGIFSPSKIHLLILDVSYY